LEARSISEEEGMKKRKTGLFLENQTIQRMSLLSFKLKPR
jgi:hypothetical protein